MRHFVHLIQDVSCLNANLSNVNRIRFMSGEMRRMNGLCLSEPRDRKKGLILK